ncbi:hypothetical protein [Natranaerofaba carboxydovora]|uniref:hypothetical protein n=1 Tax=Natranaerofaba carboxydovora TaxID=2742683 RepID=UPI001F13C42E|nr:hypothetical protein [Natranaerofaba carboxydovora]UMZ72904.1 Trigger factor [Natranaerofaba carboxydovora]
MGALSTKETIRREDYINIEVELKTSEFETDDSKNEAIYEKLMEKLFQEYWWDVPDDIVWGEVDGRLKDFEKEIRRDGISLMDYAKNKGLTLEEFTEEMYDETKKRLNREIILETIANNENISPSESEIDKEIEKVGRRYGYTKEAAKALIKRNNDLDKLKKKALLIKTKQFLIDNAKVSIK